MMSTEPNGTMTILANTKKASKSRCIDWENFEWLFTYHPQYMWFIFVLGFIENFFVISVFVLHKRRCTVTEIYLGNMAATDLILVSCHPFWAIYVSNKYSWQFGVFMCKAVSYLFRLNLYNSIYFLMMVSIERYLALVKPMTIGRLRRPCWSKVTCGIIWILAAVLSVPSGMFRRVTSIKKLNITICASVRSSPNKYIAPNVILNVLGFLVPLAVTAFCTYHMIRVLRTNAMREFKKVNNERRATWLVLSVFLIFIVCWTPYNIYTFIDTLHQFKVSLPCMVPINRIIHQISFYIVLSNSCINPVIYSMLGNHFRQKAREVYSRFLCQGPTVGSVNSTQTSFMGPSEKKSIDLICDCNVWAHLHQSQPQDSTVREKRPPPNLGCLSEGHGKPEYMNTIA